MGYCSLRSNVSCRCQRPLFDKTDKCQAGNKQNITKKVQSSNLDKFRLSSNRLHRSQEKKCYLSFGDAPTVPNDNKSINNKQKTESKWTNCMNCSSAVWLQKLNCSG